MWSTYYGHGSSIALLVFFGLIALRVFSSQRRKQRGQTAPGARSFADPTMSRPQGDGTDTSSGEATFTGIAPGWLIDPSGRHEQRYWSGSEWTEHVLDRGVPGTDPPPRDGGGASS